MAVEEFGEEPFYRDGIPPKRNEARAETWPMKATVGGFAVMSTGVLFRSPDICLIGLASIGIGLAFNLSDTPPD